MQEKTTYYNEIKDILINNEISKSVKDYSKNKNELESYYNVGKILSEAGKHYGEGIVKEYSIKLTNELGKGYNISALKRMRQFYLMVRKGATVSHFFVSWSHYVELLKFDNINEINYYINKIETEHLSVRNLRKIIKEKEYERLPDKTKENNKYITLYSSDKRIKATQYQLI